MKLLLIGARSRAGLVLAGAMALAVSAAPAAAEPTFAPLLGTWGGGGTYKLQDGTSEKIRCDAYYTGSGSQLGIAVRCTGQTNKIEMRSKLTANGSSLSGNWEERTYNADGTVSGKLSESSIALSITGGVSGSMHIRYDKSTQNVSIQTAGTPLKSVTISLSRK